MLQILIFNFDFKNLKGAKGDKGDNATTTAVVNTSANGLAPKVTDTSKFLKGDGTWATPTDTTYTIGTSGNNVTLTPIGGSAQSITVPYATNAGSATDNTKVSKSGDTMTGQLAFQTNSWAGNIMGKNANGKIRYDWYSNSSNGSPADNILRVYNNADGTTYSQYVFGNTGVFKTPKSLNIADKVTLQYNSTNECLDFNFL